MPLHSFIILPTGSISSLHVHNGAGSAWVRKKFLCPHVHGTVVEWLLLFLMFKRLRHETLLEELVLALQVSIQLHLNLHSNSCTFTRFAFRPERSPSSGQPGVFVGDFGTGTTFRVFQSILLLRHIMFHAMAWNCGQ